MLRSRGVPRIMPPITGPRRDGVRRGLPPAAKPRHGPLSRVLQAPPYRHTRDAYHGGEAHETSLSNHFRGRGWDPAVSLTKLRAKPAVPLGAKYRLIDIPISNCINSEIHRIYVLTQFNSASIGIWRAPMPWPARVSPPALSKCSPPSKRRTARVGLKAPQTPCASICGSLVGCR